MKDTLIFLSMLSFSAMLLLNIYFRFRVFRAYQKLSKLRIQFGEEHIHNKALLEKEVIAKHPEHKAVILTFVNHLHLSRKLMFGLMCIITFCGAVLMYYR